MHDNMEMKREKNKILSHEKGKYRRSLITGSLKVIRFGDNAILASI